MTDNSFDLALVQIGARLPSYFRRRIRDSATAEDLAQETLLKAYRSRGALRDPTRIEAWIYRIAHVTLIDHFRRRSPLGELPNELACEPDPETNRVSEVVVSTARCYLETLPNTYRDPVHLADYEGLPHIEVSRRLGLSLPAVKSRVRRGRLMVRHLVEAACEFEYDARGNIVGYQARVRAIPRPAT